VTESHRAALETATLAGSLAQVTERQRSLAPQLVDKLRDTGLLRSGVPGQPGGVQATPSGLIALASGKKPLGSSRSLAERATVQAEVAQAEAALRAARALYTRSIDEAWQAAQRPEPVSDALRVGLRLAATHATRTSAEVTRTMYDLAGGSAVYENSPSQRRFRDAHTATAHFQVGPTSFEVPGRLLLGLPTRTDQL
jgi:hypothetical protein